MFDPDLWMNPETLPLNLMNAALGVFLLRFCLGGVVEFVDELVRRHGRRLP